MIKYEPCAFVFIPNTSIQIPSKMEITDVSISREIKIDCSQSIDNVQLFPPKDIVSRAPSLWREIVLKEDGSCPDFAGEFSGQKSVFDVHTKNVTVEEIQKGNLDIYDDILDLLENLDGESDTLQSEDEAEEERKIHKNVGPFEKGDKVMVVSLQKETSKNGAKGFVTDVIHSTTSASEYFVEFSNKQAGKFKEINLRGLEPQFDNRFIKLYRGGCVIDSPLVVDAGEEVNVSVYWSVFGTDLGSGKPVHKAEATFSAMHDAVKSSDFSRPKKGVSTHRALSVSTDSRYKACT